MAAQKGRDVLVKVDTTGGGSFSTVGGGRSKSISLNSETVDITDADSVGAWRELLEGGGIRTATITLSGVFKDSASENTVRSYFFGPSIRDYQFIIPSFAQLEGLFQVAALDYAGEHNGEATYSMTFESAGDITYTAI